MMMKISAIVLLVAASALAKDAPQTEMNKVTASEVISTLFSMLKDETTTKSLARIDASLKSVLGNPLTGLVYAASLAVGVVTLLAFYESPLSPLPVPSLPKPPVGRFPPEHPSWPPVARNPVKVNQGGNYGGNYGGYAASASNNNQAFALPNVLGKNAFAGYDKTQFSNNYNLNNAAEQNFGGFQASASNVYPSIVSPPQSSQLKRVNYNIQASGRPQIPVLQNRKSDTVQASITIKDDDKGHAGSVHDVIVTSKSVETNGHDQ